MSVTTPNPSKIGQPVGGADHPSGAAGDDDPHPRPSATNRRSAGGSAVVLAGAVYSALSLTVWWNVWTNHPSSTTTCGCGDTSLFIWYMEWPAYALSHGLDPLYSTALFHPVGIDLLSNTSVLAVGIVLAPITWLFGPVASLNLALALAPVLSALAMFVLLRRWVSWSPAAFIGGLFYGFSPFVIVNLTNAYLMTALAVVPPLVVLCLDELFFRQRRRPLFVGVGLGLLVALQFFIGTEVLIIMAISTLVGMALLVAAGLRAGGIGVDRLRRGVVGLAAGSITAAVLLIYPTWLALAGPAHLSGPVWPGRKLNSYGVMVKQLVIPTRNASGYVRLAGRIGGYPGPWLSPEYLGIGALVVVIIGLVLWRRDRRLWFFAAVAALSLVLSLGADKPVVLPWQLLDGLPLLENVIPDRFVLITYLAIAVMLGLIVDHVFHSAAAWRRHGGSLRRPPGSTDAPPPRSRWFGGLAATAVAAVALGPVAVYLAAVIPMSAQPVVAPTWFRTVAPTIGHRPVLLVFPVPYAGIQSAMTWQAVSRMSFDMVGGGGPGGVVSRDGVERAGEVLFGDATYSQFYTNAPYGPGSLTAMRRALRQWGVDTVVLPDQPRLPLYDRVTSVPFVAALMTAVTGRAPLHQENAWVWSGVSTDSQPPVGIAALSGCTSGPNSPQREGVGRVVSCVLRSR